MTGRVVGSERPSAPKLNEGIMWSEGRLAVDPCYRFAFLVCVSHPSSANMLLAGLVVNNGGSGSGSVGLLESPGTNTAATCKVISAIAGRVIGRAVAVAVLVI